ncbi:MAG TPA: amidohydrolase family protein [Polyangiaceae bacterium]|nr:amidohydrolase family protein [Polyangiaceae bacterium]
MIIDVHTHAFPDFLAEKAMAALSEPLGDWKPTRDGTLSSLQASMHAAGVDRIFLASIATRPEQAKTILSWSLQIKSERIVPLGSVHPRSPNWEAELDAIAEAGLPGIKLHPQYQQFVVDQEELLPIYRRAAQLGLFVLFHAGFDIAFPGNDHASPERLARVHSNVEGLIMVAAHLGGWQAWDDVEKYLVGRDIYLDTSYLHQLPVAQLVRIFSRHSHDRIVFGSDSPWLSQKDCIGWIRDLPIPPASISKILGTNALSLHPTLNDRALLDQRFPSQQFSRAPDSAV